MTALLLAIALWTTAQQAAAPPGEPLQPLVLEVEFEGGRTSHQAVGPVRATAWTPVFPRVAGWRPAGGQLAASAIRYTVERSPDGLRYSVSVLLGPEHQQEELVATGMLQPDQRVVVDGLVRYGARPIALTVRALAAGSVHQPAVINHTAGIQVSDITIEIEPSPRYRVTLQNLTDQAALSVGIETRLAGSPAHSGVQGNEDGEPILPARGTHAFHWPFATGPQPAANRGVWTPLPVDELIVTSVVWTNGSYEGDARAAASQRVRDLARSLQLDRVVPLLQSAVADSAPLAATLSRLALALDTMPIDNDGATLDVAIARMPSPDLMRRDEVNQAMRTTRQRVVTRAANAVKEVGRSFQSTGDAADAHETLAALLQRFSDWRARLAR